MYLNKHFDWKIYTVEKEQLLPNYYKQILTGFINIIGDIKRIGIYKSITERFFLFLFTQKPNTLESISNLDIKNFMLEISLSRPKSMDDVVTVLRRLHSYLHNEGFINIFFESILIAPRARDKRVLPCIVLNEIHFITTHINLDTPSGKRDYAIIQLSIHTGLRAGDIANQN